MQHEERKQDRGSKKRQKNGMEKSEERQKQHKIRELATKRQRNGQQSYKLRDAVRQFHSSCL